jgi:homogentisate 1,2-dioxygenase
MRLRRAFASWRLNAKIPLKRAVFALAFVASLLAWIYFMVTLEPSWHRINTLLSTILGLQVKREIGHQEIKPGKGALFDGGLEHGHIISKTRLL